MVHVSVHNMFVMLTRTVEMDQMRLNHYVGIQFVTMMNINWIMVHAGPCGKSDGFGRRSLSGLGYYDGIYFYHASPMIADFCGNGTCFQWQHTCDNGQCDF